MTIVMDTREAMTNLWLAPLNGTLMSGLVRTTTSPGEAPRDLKCLCRWTTLRSACSPQAPPVLRPPRGSCPATSTSSPSRIPAAANWPATPEISASPVDDKERGLCDCDEYQLS